MKLSAIQRETLEKIENKTTSFVLEDLKLILKRKNFPDIIILEAVFYEKRCLLEIRRPTLNGYIIMCRYTCINKNKAQSYFLHEAERNFLKEYIERGIKNV